MVGGLRKTTVEAVERFIQQRTAQSTPAMPNADLATSAAMADDPRRRTVAAMQERLREKGIALKTGADLESDQADGVAK